MVFAEVMDLRKQGMTGTSEAVDQRHPRGVFAKGWILEMQHGIGAGERGQAM
jgi:hypothetical protein